ncbi:hypothetical protein [Streptomyces cahuitamycinicus]|uniref:Integral membrane protein n=1 Tax=Streptomyces cahuitamycinicus TaxID=2070367 RepID=A0A2N8TSV6_9ACTN|nr:hypothetical protein [Streptomyces cahuitamycinicus]PNG22099.1 hypothetical protein C1J00_11360 [Streptomyces cahuitamycinicus]
MLLTLLCLSLTGAGPADAAGGGKDEERTGKLTVDIGWDASREKVVVRKRCTYTLGIRSEALAQLRMMGVGFCQGYSVKRDGEAAGYDSWDAPAVRVTQESSRSPVRVETNSAVHLSRRSGPQRLDVRVNVASAFKHAPEGLPGVWTVEVRAPRWSFRGIKGPVASQSPGVVTWRVTTASQDAPAMVGTVALERTVETTKPPSSRRQSRAEPVTVFGLAVCGIGVVAACLVVRLAGPAVPRRWATVAMVLTVAACPLAFLGTQGQREIWRYSGPPSDPSGQEWAPGPALGMWLWYVLPVAGWWFSHRLVTRRPPSTRVLVVSGAAPLLVLPLLAAGGTVLTPAGWGRLVGLLLLTLALFLVLHCLAERGTAVRRWAAAGGTFMWIVGLTYGLGGAPIMTDDDSTVTTYEAAAVLVCTWPVAVWLTSLLGPVLGRTPRPAVRAVSCAAFWALVLSPFLVAHMTTPPQAWSDTWDYYKRSFFTGYMGFPLCAVAVCGVVLQLVYLIRRGALGDRGRAAEPVGRVLLVCGVLMALGNPSLRTLSMWGDALAVLCTALGSLWLIPLGSDATAAGFRRVSRKAHARLMGRWVRTQLLWDTRADFQRASRSALVDGDMSAAEFSERWEKLDVPGGRGDPATRLARVKRCALGTSAGTAPRSAGAAGAALALLLALPWAAYKLVTADPVGADAFMPFHLEEVSKALRFAHWALYGFVFGYFYALLRGSTPIAKAAALMAVVLPAEVLAMIPLTVDPQFTRNPSWNDMVVACGGLAGQTFVVCMGLGLVWEWWLARAAALKWSQVRNFRRLSSITVPLGTVLVAAATAFATVVAGAWAQQELQPPPGTPSSSPAAQVQPGQAGR